MSEFLAECQITVYFLSYCPFLGLSPMKAPQPMMVTPKGPAPTRTSLGPQSAPVPQQMTPMRPQMQPNTPIGFNVNTRQQTPGMQSSFYQSQSAGLMQRPIGMAPQSMPYRRTPYPIINHNQKGVLEKMVDYLVGDGPSSRFAMICRECLMHNGRCFSCNRSKSEITYE